MFGSIFQSMAQEQPKPPVVIDDDEVDTAGAKCATTCGISCSVTCVYTGD